MKEERMPGWIGVDLDGTLARYDGWNDGVIGEPIPEMVKRVRSWVSSGRKVRIFTARVCNDPHKENERAIQKWCLIHLGYALEVTCVKDFEMIELWDDRAVQVVHNKGIPIRPLKSEMRRPGRKLQRQ